MNLLRISDLTQADVQALWKRVGMPDKRMTGTVAWSFEGNGIRTRTTFIQAFRELGLSFTELPNLLKTAERARDLAGYLDPFYEIYVIRESNHTRLNEFAAATRRPVINAMSNEGHPCEVLTDAYFAETEIMPLAQAHVCLWGPPTNVFRSWHELAAVLGISVTHACAPRFHQPIPNVRFVASAPTHVDLVITDAWPEDSGAESWSLTEAHLAHMGHPKLLPTPPFSIGRELSLDPLTCAGFVGYRQKALLLDVQKAILRHAFER